MEFAFEFDRSGDVPLYRSLSDAIKTAISDGRLVPGQKIPSVRVLSELVDVSRNTAHQCYQTLISEGYVEALPRTGLFVSKSMVSRASEPPVNRAVKPPGNRGVEPEHPPVTKLAETLLGLEPQILAHQRAATALNHQMPSIDDLPVQQIKRALIKHARLNEPELLGYSGDPFGHPVLREAFAAYVLRARGIKCSADQVVVSSRPSQELLDLVCRLFLTEGSWVAVEHPGYSQPRQIFELHDARILPIPVDEDGIRVDMLASADKPVEIVYVTPSHQDPMGAILSQSRRKQLLDWAQKTNAIIWEDDVENEYRYGSDPIPALFAMDNHNRVIYQSTFWRTLCPIIRMGFVVLPPGRTRELVQLAKYMLDRDLPIMEQLVVADLINDGHFDRHVREMRKKFTARRQTAIHQLKLKLQSLVTIFKNTSGLHLRVLVDPSLTKEFVLQCGRESGLPITSTCAYYIDGAPENEFLIQFAHTSEKALEEEIDAFAQRLKS